MTYEHFVNVVQVPPSGCRLVPPLKIDRSERDWELDEKRETVGASSGGALVLVVCYWKRPIPEN